MRTLLLRSLLLLVVAAVTAQVTTFVAGLVVARRTDEGDEDSDTFRRTVVMNSLAFECRAAALRRGSLTVALGGARLDLRAATLDPVGADLEIENTMGGVQVLVPEHWAVSVEDELIGGGDIQVDTSDPSELPLDAPRLRIRLVTRLGGSVVSTQEPVY